MALGVGLASGCEAHPIPEPSPRDLILTPVHLGAPRTPPAVGLSGEAERSSLAEEVRIPGGGLDFGILVLEWGEGQQRTLPAEVGRHFVVMLPDTWTIERGRFAGEGVPLGAIFSSGGPVPTLLDTGTRTWQRWPIPVLGDGDGWQETDCGEGAREVPQAVSFVNKLVGRELFLMVPEPAHRQEGVFVGCLEEEAPHQRLGVTRLSPPECVSLADARATCAPDWIRYAEVRVRPGSNPVLLAHELLHAAGLGHTCVMESLMATEFSDSQIDACAVARATLGFEEPFLISYEPGAADVAALELLWTLSAALGDRRGRSIIWHP